MSKLRFAEFAFDEAVLYFRAPHNEPYGDYTTRRNDTEEIMKSLNPYQGPLVFFGFDTFKACAKLIARQ
ncbi:MAG: hypothetical protein AMJ88_17650 [Anaerolineae bacterium SM23_ 63]|nr:MAG: hypothetical protein AMJ88_17650 [Anaerolineae bacterium SM23_ 63]